MTSRLLVIAFAIVLSTAPRAHAGPDEDAKALLVQGAALEKVGDWAKAREVYARLQKTKAYEGVALYRQAWVAFNDNALDEAMIFAQRAILVGGPQRLDAKFLYGDALFRAREYARAREIYVSLRDLTIGDAKATAEKKIAAVDRALGSPPATVPTPSPPKPGPSGDELYQQAVAAVQKDDLAAALPLALKASQQDGTHKTDARVLYGDLLVRRGEFQRAKDIYIALRKLTTGDVRAIVTRKVTETNRALKLPETDGLTD